MKKILFLFCVLFSYSIVSADGSGTLQIQTTDSMTSFVAMTDSGVRQECLVSPTLIDTGFVIDTGRSQRITSTYRKVSLVPTVPPLNGGYAKVINMQNCVLIDDVFGGKSLVLADGRIVTMANNNEEAGMEGYIKIGSLKNNTIQRKNLATKKMFREAKILYDTPNQGGMEAPFIPGKDRAGIITDMHVKGKLLIVTMVRNDDSDAIIASKNYRFRIPKMKK